MKDISSDITIIFEDDDLLVINKPAGVIVNRSHTIQNDEMTVQDWVEGRGSGEGIRYQVLGSRGEQETGVSNQVVIGDGRGEEEQVELKIDEEDTSGEEDFYSNPEEIFAQRSGIAHRLDKETSGVLLIAKKPDVLIHLLKQFKNRTTQKTYLALAHGKFQTEKGDIDLPIGRNSKYRLQFAVRGEGKPSLTHYQVRQYFPHINAENIVHDLDTEGRQRFIEVRGQQRSKNFKKLTKIYQGFSLVKVFPKTGRTHQIRVHLSHIQHPIVGDKTYVGKKRMNLDEVWCARHFLHAESLTITHPTTEKEITFTAPLTADLQKALGYLQVE